jgi:hypothetical protein
MMLIYIIEDVIVPFFEQCYMLAVDYKGAIYTVLDGMITKIEKQRK